MMCWSNVITYSILEKMKLRESLQWWLCYIDDKSFLIWLQCVAVCVALTVTERRLIETLYMTIISYLKKYSPSAIPIEEGVAGLLRSDCNVLWQWPICGRRRRLAWQCGIYFSYCRNLCTIITLQYRNEKPGCQSYLVATAGQWSLQWLSLMKS